MNAFSKRILALLGGFIISLSTYAAGFVEIPDSLWMARSHIIEFEDEVISLSWERRVDFIAPYHVAQISTTGDTLFSATTCQPSIPVDVSGKRNLSRVILRSHDGVVKEFILRSTGYTFPWMIVIISTLSLAMVGVALWSYLRTLNRKRIQALKSAGEKDIRQTKHYDSATVLFSDIQGFTKIAEHMNPEQLVDELDRYFIYFDELVDKYGVEKIKTIGDAYMCAGGVPEQDSANPIEVVLVGLEMIAYVQERRHSKEGFWNIRVGINTGPVISGHLGNIKKVFDIWGDSVNTASRMESSGEPGRVNVSGSTYVKIQDFFECEYRGRMPVKYKGEVDMYFVNRLKEEYCVPGSTYQPNALLMRKLQVLKISDFEAKVKDSLLGDGHPNLICRMDRYLSRVRMLAHLEMLTDDEQITCGVAAILIYVQKEFPGDKLVQDKKRLAALMKKMHLTATQIDNINRVTLHVEQSRQPEGRVEEVLVDAANEVYGRKDLIPLLCENYADIASRGVSQTQNEWLSHQLVILKKNVFYTDAAKRLCEVQMQRQVDALSEYLSL